MKILFFSSFGNSGLVMLAWANVGQQASYAFMGSWIGWAPNGRSKSARHSGGKPNEKDGEQFAVRGRCS